MASIRKRGENSYLLVVSRGYDYQGNRLKPAQKTVHPPKGLTAKQTEKWLNEQAVLYEREVKHTPGESVDRSITLAKYIDVWLEQVAPKKLAASTLVRDKQDIRRILPALGHYKLVELNKDILRAFYDAMRSEQNWKTGGLLAEKTVEGIHSCLCGILSDAVEAGYITHNPAWRAYRKKGAPQERPVADEETVQRLITALEGQSLKYEVYFKLILATGMRRGEACGLRWSDIDWRQRALHIRRNVVKLSGQPILVKEPKTRAGCGWYICRKNSANCFVPGKKKVRGRKNSVVEGNWRKRTICSDSPAGNRWCRVHSHSGSKRFCGRAICRTI